MLTEQVGNGFQSLVHFLKEGYACDTMLSYFHVMNFHTRGSILEVKAEMHSSCLTWFYDRSGILWQGDTDFLIWIPWRQVVVVKKMDCAVGSIHILSYIIVIQYVYVYHM
jgi:hypothetical protein